jgi:signal transduction histidine kinase
VSDCRLDSRFERRPYVVADTGAVRFYAGVPIISRNGHFIGVLAVADELPRDGLTVDELQFMQHLAQVVMDHLEWARDRVDRFKGERIVRSLAAFIEGSSTVHDETETAETTKGGATGYSSDGRPPEISLAGTRRPPYSRHQSNRSPDLRPTDESPPEQPHKLITPSPAGSPIITPSKPVNRLKPADGLSRMYHRAADLLRHSALADGVVLLGAATHIKPVSSTKNGELMPPNEEDPAVHLTSGSESFGPDSSDSDTAPSARACRILAYSLADQRARADIEEGSALSLGTLEKYFSLFPKGKTFSFTDQGAGVSSEDDSASDREPLKGGGENGDSANESVGSRRRRPRIDHRELLKKIPGAKTVVFLPLYDYAEDRLAGGCFLWTSVTGRMMNLDEDLSYLRAFGNSIMSQVGRINTQKNEAAKTTFIASMSHELRSPLHGILGAVEFLKSTNTSSHQTDLVNSIYTCGKTLLDTLNHVLDYSKINRLGRVQIRRGARQNKLIGFSSDSLDSLNMTGVVDLAVLVEEVVDSIAAGHTFKKLPIPGISEDAGAGTVLVPDATTAALSEPGTVSILMDVCSKTSWMVKTQPGALRRIIMNLFGNALKYTTSGVVMVSLRGQVNAAETKVDVLIRVMDTGKGMSEDFQRNRLFVPFSQEDTFQPGTGLGLSIVKQIVDSLGGSLELRSQQYKGTEVDVRLRLPRASEDLTPPPSDEILHSVIKQTRGRSLMIMGRDAVAASPYPGTQRARKLSDSLSETCSNWFGLRVTGEEYDRDVSQPDMYLYCEPPSVQILEEHFRKSRTAAIGAKKIPIIIVCPNAEEAARISRLHSTALTGFSSIVEVIAQP